MHLLNFIISILLPYVTFLNLLTLPNTIPIYFYSPEAAFVASQFYVVVFYWAGFLRNSVSDNTITDQLYFGLYFIIFIFMCVSKIILALPYTWAMSIIAFGLGVLSVSSEQSVGKKSMYFMVAMSVFIVGYAAFILIGMAWFGFTPESYYYYKIMFKDMLHNL